MLTFILPLSAFYIQLNTIDTNEVLENLQTPTTEVVVVSSTGWQKKGLKTCKELNPTITRTQKSVQTNKKIICTQKLTRVLTMSDGSEKKESKIGRMINLK